VRVQKSTQGVTGHGPDSHACGICVLK